MDILYMGMCLTLVGQILVGDHFYIGQVLYLIANIIYVTRDFKLRRPAADKIKNSLFTAVTVGIILLRLLTK